MVVHIGSSTLDATRFPASFTFQPGFIGNGSVSATIKETDRKLEFYTITPVPVSSLHGEVAEVTIIVTKCPSIQCKCPYGFLKDNNGFNTCTCFDPCRSIDQKVCREVKISEITFVSCLQVPFLSKAFGVFYTYRM